MVIHRRYEESDMSIHRSPIPRVNMAAGFFENKSHAVQVMYTLGVKQWIETIFYIIN